MANHGEVIADLQATIDFIEHEITERADSMPLDEARAYVGMLKAVKKASEEAIALLDTGMLKQVEGGAKQIGDLLFYRVRERVLRFQHAQIRNEIRGIAISKAVNKETGEINAHTAVDLALAMMANTYLNPSMKAKTTVLKELGVKNVVTEEDKGWKLEVRDTGLGED